MKTPYKAKSLPIDINWSDYIRLMTEANRELARYDEAINKLQNPDIIKRSFDTKEATLSSKIEGTQITVDEVLNFDAEDTKEEITEKDKDYREVINYRQAIIESVEMLKEQPLSENLIKNLNRILLNSVRGSHRNPGEFRRNQAHIGAPGSIIEEADFVPVAPQDIVTNFSNLVKYINDDSQPDKLVQAAIIHFQFEAIHPFSDGNGRTGRLLIPVFLYNSGVVSSPNLYISEFFEEYRSEYISALRGVSENNDWKTWIEFFLRAVREQSKILKARVDKVEKLYKKIHEELPSFGSIHASSFLDAIFKSPVFNASKIMKESGIENNQTIYTLIKKFEDKGYIHLITPPGQKRNKMYRFSELYRIIK